MTWTRIRRVLGAGMMAVCIGALQPSPGWAQAANSATAAQLQTSPIVEQPDAQRTREELSALLAHPPAGEPGVTMTCATAGISKSMDLSTEYTVLPALAAWSMSE